MTHWLSKEAADQRREYQCQQEARTRAAETAAKREAEKRFEAEQARLNERRAR